MNWKDEEISTMHPIRLFTWLIAIGLVAFAVFFHFDADIYKRNVAVIFALSLFLPWAIYENTEWIKKRYRESVMYAIELVWAIIVVLNALGAAGYYHLSQTYHYDDLLHFTVPLLSALALSVAIGLYLEHNDEYDRRRTIILTLAVLFVLLFVWELYEWGGDLLFGTFMSGQEGQPLDTVYDVALGLLSMPFSAALMNFGLDSFIMSHRRRQSSGH